MAKLYRVIARTTGSKQPTGCGTTWDEESLYCGPNRDEARQVYHASTPKDYGGSHGNGARETHSEEIDDAGTDDFSEDPIT